MNLRRALLAASLACCAACGAREQLPPMARMEMYGDSLSLPFERRITAMPPALLEEYRRMDARPDYSAHVPTDAEKALVLRYLRLMPPAFERAFRARCVGLYFVEGFAGSGMTSWVRGADGRAYFHMALNPAVFGQTLSRTLTERERSCFAAAPGYSVSVDAGVKYKGLAYALFHESAHALDYVEGLSPMADPELPAALRRAPAGGAALFARVWDSYSAPKPAADYPARASLTFYGLGGGPKLKAGDAAAAYEELAASPFISLYGSKSWAEDYAELTAYALITGRLGQPYRITVSGPRGRKVYEPMKGRAGARARAALELAEKI